MSNIWQLALLKCREWIDLLLHLKAFFSECPDKPLEIMCLDVSMQLEPAPLSTEDKVESSLKAHLDYLHNMVFNVTEKRW